MRWAERHPALRPSSVPRGWCSDGACRDGVGVPEDECVQHEGAIPSHSSTTRPPHAGCAAVVLAAGEARRFGSQKLVMPFGDATVIGSVVAALQEAGVAPIVVVTGPDDEVLAALRGTTVCTVRNPDPARGMLSSIQIGVSALPGDVARFLIALGDQPRLRPADLVKLLLAHQEGGKGTALPLVGGKRGHPVVFAGRYRDVILSLAGAQTLRDLIHSHRADCLEVECDSDAFVRDIDTREQYQDELRRL